jgi:hypothetical protein
MPLQFSDEDRQKLDSIRRSRVEEKRRTLRAAILLDSWSGQSDESIAQRHHVSRSTVVLYREVSAIRPGCRPGRVAALR